MIAKYRHQHVSNAKHHAAQHPEQQRIHGPRLYMMQRTRRKPPGALLREGVCSRTQAGIALSSELAPDQTGAGKASHVVTQRRPVARKSSAPGPHPPPPQVTAVAQITGQAVSFDDAGQVTDRGELTASPSPPPRPSRLAARLR